MTTEQKALITQFADEIAARQYYKKDENGVPVEDYKGMLRRVARHAARAEAIDAFRADNGRYPEWYMSFEGRRKNLLDLETLDNWIEEQGYTQLCKQWEEEFYRILVAQKFSPGGRILAGSESQYGQLNNCFVAAPNGRHISKAKDDLDSIDGIYELSYKLAKITKTGGGCGINLDFMRPSGSHVQGSGGKSSGPVSFLRLNYNTTLRVIKLEGVRRGAGMATLSLWHPDALDFITAKDADREDIEGRIEAFNISLLISDEFMEAVENDAPWYFKNKVDDTTFVAPSTVPGKYHLPGEPATSVTGNPADPATSKEIPLLISAHGPAVPAKWLWDEICNHAWESGDPGIIFIDRVNEYWPMHEAIGPINSTNPCWTGDTRVWTIDGPKSFEELAATGEDVKVLTQVDGELVFRTMRNPRMTYEASDLVEILLDTGKTVRCTPNHKVVLRDGRKIQARELSPGDSIASVYRYKANSKGYLRLDNGEEAVLEHHVVASSHLGRRPDYPYEHVHHKDWRVNNNLPDNLEVMSATQHNRMHMLGENNPMYGIWDERNPLFGLDTAGENNGRYRQDINTDLLEELRDAGMSYAAIASEVGCSKYTVMKRLGWERPEVAVNHKVVEVRPLAYQAPVYNGTVDESHTYFVFVGENDAILSANCGEQPLAPGEACCLGSMILDRYVVEGDFDFDSFYKDSQVAIRFLDNVLTITTHPIEDTQEWCDRLRRVGLGVMGDAAMLMRMELPFDSQEAMRLRSQIAEELKKATLSESEQLAELKGPFPFFEKSDFEGVTPRRNVHTMSIQPTGTVSMVADTTSGIEPLFALAMQRRVGSDYKFRLDPTFENYIRSKRPDINLDDESVFVPVDMMVGHDAKGNNIRESVMIHPVVKAIMNNHGSISGLDEFFDTEEQRIFVTAHDVTPVSHVKVQGVWQRNLDSDEMVMSSISKTVNLPNEATVDEVKEIYALGFKERLKGVTMYRDGSKSAQVLRTDLSEEKEDKEEPKVAEKAPSPVVAPPTSNVGVHRPRRTTGEMIKAEFRDANGKERKVYIYVGLDEQDYPVEVFITDEDGGHDVHPYAAALGRIVSTALKYGAPPRKVAQKLSKIEGGSVAYGGGIYQSVPAMVGRLLMEAIDYHDSKAGIDTSNAECEHVMRHESGCQVCVNCGYSKCA